MVLMIEARGASNAKAKRELGWTLRYPSWRQGFAAAYGTSTTTDGRTFDTAAIREPLVRPTVTTSRRQVSKK